MTAPTPIRRWALGFAALGAGMATNLVTGRHVDAIGASLAPARDLLHDVLPRLDLPLIHVYGFVGFTIVVLIGAAFFEPRERAPLLLWAYGLIIGIRAVFTVLTPIGIPPDAPSFEGYPIQGVAQYFDFRHQMFFSGHTAFPFLAFLVCRTPWVRWASLGFSLLLASEVLLSRLHYSIDVAAAFFIAFAVARLAERSFARLAPAAPDAAGVVPPALAGSERG